MKINFKNKIIKFLLILQWLIITGGIYYFSSQQSIEFLPSKIWDYDKLVHFFVFLIYGFSSISMIIGFNSGLKLGKILFISAIIGIAFGGIDEIHQSFTPGRNPDFYDFCADLIGVLVSILSFKLILKKNNFLNQE
jgi:VanZ family protein